MTEAEIWLQQMIWRIEDIKRLKSRPQQLAALLQGVKDVADRYGNSGDVATEEALHNFINALERALRRCGALPPDEP